MAIDRTEPGTTTDADDRSGLTRRSVLQGAAGVGVIGVAGTVLAACGGDEPTTTPTGGASTPAATGGGASGSIAGTADVPVSGGLVLESPDAIVITQPVEGEFKAFSAICTHQQCPVGTVTNNVIMCPCHGSTYDATTGEPTGGPAPSALSPIEITVDGDQILLA